ncbi:heme exporter protein CcmD [Halomonas elongata]|uniref:heme exporter protein CcmD n=1 Tax=Halomonas elongata TaxID=2746 RepID=UPI0038D46F5D
MAFDSFAAFLVMGGHAAYVWPAYGATMLLLLGVVLHLRLERRRLWRELRRRARRERQQVRNADREARS